MENALRQLFEQSFPGMTHQEIAVLLLAGTGVMVLLLSALFAKILHVKFLADFGCLAFVVCIVLAVIKIQIG